MEVYSPEQSLYHPLFEQKSIQVHIKRDDMIHPFISGNKWRKLKYNIASAKEQQKSTLVTFGGAWSNHLLATACAGATYNLQTIGFVRGEEINNPVLNLCQLFGMQLRFVDRESYKNKKDLFKTLPNPTALYFIDEGGSGTLAVKGCEELITELKQPYDYIVCAAGTGTTAAGLAQAIKKKNLSTQLLVVPVLKGGEFIAQEMINLGATINQTSILTQYHFGGYAKTKPELITFIKDFVSKTGILIEPTYTGKSMYALFDLANADFFKKDSKILFIHTGGLTGYLGMMDKFI